MNKLDFILTLYNNRQTVFRLSDVVMMVSNVSENTLSERLGYYVRTGRLLRLRKGIYAKPNYNPLELANLLFTPSYTSLEYVLQQAGIIFQYDSRYTCVSYLSREVIIDEKVYHYRRLKPEILIHPLGIVSDINGYNIASPERAFLDLLYLNKDLYVDYPQGLNKDKLEAILPVYQSDALKKRIAKIFRQ